MDGLLDTKIENSQARMQYQNFVITVLRSAVKKKCTIVIINVTVRYIRTGAHPASLFHRVKILDGLFATRDFVKRYTQTSTARSLVFRDRAWSGKECTECLAFNYVFDHRFAQ